MGDATSEWKNTMPRIPERWDGLNQTYFVTVVTRKRKPVFTDDGLCLELQNAFKDVHKFHPFRLAALVVLKKEKRKTIWQAKFIDHRIRDEDDFANHVEYIRMNPHKHGLAQESQKYKWLFIHNNPFK
jgi:REP element-mobilizing transposase RayT